MNSEFVKRLTDIVEANLADENFGVEDLVREMDISHINLHRKLKTITNQTISQFIREIRLKKARELLLNEDLTVSEISYRVGFGSPTYFNKCFHEYFGYPPGEARKDGFAGTVQTSAGENHQFPEETPANLIQEHKLKWVNRRRNLVFVSAGVIFLLLFFYIIFNIFISSPYATKSLASTDKSVIVLPFKNLSPDEGNQYFADGIAEDILNHLFRITALRVVSRGSAEQFRESNHSAREIARKMDVNYVLEGSVRRENDKVRISVQLIDARRDQHVWSEIYDRQLTDIFAIQSDIAQKVARELQSALSPAEKKQIEKISTTNTEAYNYYLMGRFFWYKRTEDGTKRSIEYFEKAIAADPYYALAHAGLADAYFLQTGWRWGQWPGGYEKAKKSAQLALELDNNLAEAYVILGSILCWNDWKWEESRAMLMKAIQLNPNYSIARHRYAELLEVLGEYEASRVQINIAMELDPVNFIHRLVSAINYYRAGKYAESLEEMRRVEEINPERHFNYTLFKIYYRLGNDIRAIETIQQIMASDTATIKYVNKVNAIYNELGIKGLIQWLIELAQKKAEPDSFLIAAWYSLLEEKESALTWLEKAMAKREPAIPLIYNSDFEILRTEPRFMKISDQLGLTSYHKQPAK